ncbi:hypothetical protein HHK36_029207 [Tetracentron sinense]|uniref:HIT-type domain-containing protein n=1 Tax=Tetracentron sinense TaxID=13715 RepID=A0A834YDR1_TETSI|nr:hypothetical protein HHK36_029207 [Tetracentron sinense]
MAETIITSEQPSRSPQFTPSTRIICHVCQKQFSQYTCPRCNSRYCSLQCYKAHSLRCTESFMRENVVEELQQMQPDDETKRKMLDILKRFHSEEEMDSMDEDAIYTSIDFSLILIVYILLVEDVIPKSTLSEETIQKILSGNQVSLNDLSAEEMKRFQQAVASGELSKMIEPWEPWWLKPSAKTISLSREGAQLVQPVRVQDVLMSPQDGSESGLSSEIPPGPETPLQPISMLSSTEPSPLLAVHLVDIMYSYCFTLRLYNGDWHSDSLGAAMVVLSVSSVLGEGGQPETVSEALSHCLEQTCSPSYKHAGGLRFGMCILDDIVSLLRLGGAALVCLLCDLQRLIQAGERELKFEKPRKLKMVEIRRKLKYAERKFYFLMCWVHEQPMEAWSSLAAIVEVEKGYVSAMDHGGSKSKPVKMDGNGKALIEEVQ